MMLRTWSDMFTEILVSNDVAHVIPIIHDQLWYNEIMILNHQFTKYDEDEYEDDDSFWSILNVYVINLIREP